MSKEFGLDWREYEYGRMSEFILILQVQAEIAKREAVKSKSKSK